MTDRSKRYARQSGSLVMGKLSTVIDRAFAESEDSQWNTAEERQRGVKRWSAGPLPEEVHGRPPKVPKQSVKVESPENREKAIQDWIRFARGG